MGKIGTSIVGRRQWKPRKRHNTSNTTHKTRSDLEKQRKPLLTGTVLRIISLNPFVPMYAYEEDCHASQYAINTSGARKPRAQQGLHHEFDIGVGGGGRDRYSGVATNFS